MSEGSFRLTAVFRAAATEQSDPTQRGLLVARGPVEIVDEGEVAASVFEVDHAVVVELPMAAVVVRRELVEAVAATEVALPCPDLSEIFRPPRSSWS